MKAAPEMSQAMIDAGTDVLFAYNPDEDSTEETVKGILLAALQAVQLSVRETPRSSQLPS